MPFDFSWNTWFDFVALVGKLNFTIFNFLFLTGKLDSDENEKFMLDLVY